MGWRGVVLTSVLIGGAGVAGELMDQHRVFHARAAFYSAGDIDTCGADLLNSLVDVAGRQAAREDQGHIPGGFLDQVPGGQGAGATFLTGHFCIDQHSMYSHIHRPAPLQLQLQLFDIGQAADPLGEPDRHGRWREGVPVGFGGAMQLHGGQACCFHSLHQLGGGRSDEDAYHLPG